MNQFDERKLKLIKEDLMIAVIDKSDWNPTYRFQLLKDIESIFSGVITK